MEDPGRSGEAMQRVRKDLLASGDLPVLDAEKLDDLFAISNPSMALEQELRDILEELATMDPAVEHLSMEGMDDPKLISDSLKSVFTMLKLHSERPCA